MKIFLWQRKKYLQKAEGTEKTKEMNKLQGNVKYFPRSLIKIKNICNIMLDIYI